MLRHRRPCLEARAGNLDHATNAYRESLDIRRRILDTYGDTPEALRDLSISHALVATDFDGRRRGAHPGRRVTALDRSPDSLRATPITRSASAFVDSVAGR